MSHLAILESTPQPVDVTLIGNFEVRCHGQAVEVPLASQRLVGFLAFQPRPVRRSFISGSLWHNADEYHASASLRSTLWRLNRLDLVCASKTHLWLRPQVQVDLRNVVERAMLALRSDPAEESLVDVAHELLAVGDDILVGWYDDWVMMERERYRQIRLQALDRIGALLIETGRLFDALEVGLAATSTEPLRESAHRLLIRVHLLQGNVAEAIRQYRTYAILLRRELNGTPSPEISNLLAPFLNRADRGIHDAAGFDLSAGGGLGSVECR